MTSENAVPTNQPCPGCGALVFYEGHSELPTPLTPHRFHCHSCGRLYVVRSTSHNPPKFALSPRHEAQQADAAVAEAIAHQGHEHDTEPDTPVAVAPPIEEIAEEEAPAESVAEEPTAEAKPAPKKRATRSRKAASTEDEGEG